MSTSSGFWYSPPGQPLGPRRPAPPLPGTPRQDPRPRDGLSDRWIPVTAQVHGRHLHSMAWLPANQTWKRLRAICNTHLFSVRSLDASRGLRQQKVRELVAYVHGQAGCPIDVGRVVFGTVLNLISNTLFSFDMVDLSSEATQEFTGEEHIQHSLSPLQPSRFWYEEEDGAAANDDDGIMVPRSSLDWAWSWRSASKTSPLFGTVRGFVPKSLKMWNGDILREPARRDASVLTGWFPCSHAGSRRGATRPGGGTATTPFPPDDIIPRPGSRREAAGSEPLGSCRRAAPFLFPLNPSPSLPPHRREDEAYRRRRGGEFANVLHAGGEGRVGGEEADEGSGGGDDGEEGVARNPAGTARWRAD